MFIGATPVSSAKVPLDASSVAIQVAIKQQREFEEALRVAQERREAEQSSEQARMEERQKREVAQEKSSVQDELEPRLPEEANQAEDMSIVGERARGTSLDVTA